MKAGRKDQALGMQWLGGEGMVQGGGWLSALFLGWRGTAPPRVCPACGGHRAQGAREDSFISLLFKQKGELRWRGRMCTG